MHPLFLYLLVLIVFRVIRFESCEVYDRGPQIVQMLSQQFDVFPSILSTGRSEELVSAVGEPERDTGSITAGILAALPGCNGLWFTADCGKSRFEATEGRGEARRKLVNELGVIELELRLLSPGHTNIHVWS